MKAAELKKVIAKAKKVIRARNVFPHLDNVCIENGFLTVSDIETTFSQKIDIDPSTECLINYRYLSKIVSKAKANDTIIIESDDADVKIFFNENKFTCANHQTEGFKSCIKVNEKYTHEIALRKAVIKEIKKSSSYCSSDELRPVMTAVFLDSRGFIVSSDAHLLKFKEIGHGIEHDLLLGSKFIKALSEDDYLVYIGENYVMFSNENEILTHQRIQGNYPNWKSVIPDYSESVQINVAAKELKEKTDLALLAAHKGSHLIKYQIKKGFLNISSQGISSSMSYFSSIKIDYNNENEVNFGLRGHHIMSLLKNELYDTVNIKIIEPDRAILFNNEVIIMPMTVEHP